MFTLAETSSHFGGAQGLPSGADHRWACESTGCQHWRGTEVCLCFQYHQVQVSLVCLSVGSIDYAPSSPDGASCIPQHIYCEFILETCFFFPVLMYSSLDWADYYHTVQLKSTVYPNRQPFHRQGRRGGEGGGAGRGGGGEEGGREGRSYPLSQRHLIIVVFKIHPLELVASISIDRNVRTQKGM